MKASVTSRITRDGLGRKGARVRLSTDATARWAGDYAFTTHGLDDVGVDARIADIATHHALKEDRLDGFVALCAQSLTIGRRIFVVTDCKIREIGEAGGIVEVFVQVKEDGGARLRRPWFPLVIPAASLSVTPSDEAIAALVTARIEAMIANEEDDAQILANLRRIET